MATLRTRAGYLIWAVICYSIAFASYFGRLLSYKRLIAPWFGGILFFCAGSYFLYWFINYEKE